MAIDDVVSDFEEQITSGSNKTIQPAAGDEWLVTQLVGESPGWTLRSHTDSGDFTGGVYGGATAVQTSIGRHGHRRVNLFLTNSEYIRLNNGTGGTVNAGYSAIKTKD